MDDEEVLLELLPGAKLPADGVKTESGSCLKPSLIGLMSIIYTQ